MLQTASTLPKQSICFHNNLVTLVFIQADKADYSDNVFVIIFVILFL